jgi:hypothetical protein
MNTGHQYRTLAAAFEARAEVEIDPDVRLEFFILAGSYHRLAEQADRNSYTDLVYEAPSRRATAA